MSNWKTETCPKCAFAVHDRELLLVGMRPGDPDLGTMPIYKCRFGPPGRGRYTVYNHIDDEAHYPTVTKWTPACAQFQPSEGA